MLLSGLSAGDERWLELRHCPHATSYCCGFGQFGYLEVNIRFVPLMAMPILGRSVSEKAALELVVTGERFLPRPYELGLTHRVSADENFSRKSSVT